jgi:exopolyphosphatase/guanosine-5'-triphosphate,3'-diphosphate pyrophosphatase
MPRAISKDPVTPPIRPTATPDSSAIVVARWEWRIFGRHVPLRELGSAITSEKPRNSAETYLLSSVGPHNVKIRGGVLELKHLDRIAHGGLEQWHPVLKAAFPLTTDALRAACEVLGVAAPGAAPEGLTQEAFLQIVVVPNPTLRLVAVEKRRFRIAFGECPGEGVSLVVDGARWESLAFEHHDAALLLETLRRLRLDVRQNTNYPSGLKRIVGWPLAADVPP